MPQVPTTTHYWNWALTHFRDPVVAPAVGFAVEDVWKGDQIKIPRYPALCIEPGPLRREITGAQRLTNVFVDLLFMIYVGKVQDPELNQASALSLGELVETELHNHAQVGGDAIHSYVTELDPGYATRSGELLRACRVVFNIRGRELLAGSAP